MRFVRFAIGSTIGYGTYEDEGSIRAISSTPFLPWEPTHETFSVEQVRVLAPVLPSKIVAVGLNYRSHAEETNMRLPEEPMIFIKPTTSVIGPEETVYLPKQSSRVDHEGELAVVIGRAARNVDDVAAAESILGYTCANDVTARDLQAKDVQFTRAKGFDTFCPLGPEIVTGLDPLNLELVCRVNGEVRQKANTSDLVFGPGALVAFVSSVMTLLPGDVILTGTPAGISPIHDGDVVEVEISGIGVLRNPVSA
jgi:2-keto-4-pentenoate hydratase/2-oxohepta-3-ene-1,7-dioic acid hydratase in catechol pathway